MNSSFEKNFNSSIISASEYIKHYENKSENIESSFIIPPKIGRPGFGKIFIRFADSRHFYSPDNNDNSVKQKIDHAAREKHKCHRKKTETGAFRKNN